MFRCLLLGVCLTVCHWVRVSLCHCACGSCLTVFVNVCLRVVIPRLCRSVQNQFRIIKTSSSFVSHRVFNLYMRRVVIMRRKREHGPAKKKRERGVRRERGGSR